MSANNNTGVVTTTTSYNEHIFSTNSENDSIEIVNIDNVISTQKRTDLKNNLPRLQKKKTRNALSPQESKLWRLLKDLKYLHNDRVELLDSLMKENIKVKFLCECSEENKDSSAGPKSFNALKSDVLNKIYGNIMLLAQINEFKDCEEKVLDNAFKELKFMGEKVNSVDKNHDCETENHENYKRVKASDMKNVNVDFVDGVEYLAIMLKIEEEKRKKLARELNSVRKVNDSTTDHLQKLKQTLQKTKQELDNQRTRFAQFRSKRRQQINTAVMVSRCALLAHLSLQLKSTNALRDRFQKKKRQFETECLLLRTELDKLRKELLAVKKAEIETKDNEMTECNNTICLETKRELSASKNMVTGLELRLREMKTGMDKLKMREKKRNITSLKLKREMYRIMEAQLRTKKRKRSNLETASMEVVISS